MCLFLWPDGQLAERPLFLFRSISPSPFTKRPWSASFLLCAEIELPPIPYDLSPPPFSLGASMHVRAALDRFYFPSFFSGPERHERPGAPTGAFFPPSFFPLGERGIRASFSPPNSMTPPPPAIFFAPPMYDARSSILFFFFLFFPGFRRDGREFSFFPVDLFFYAQQSFIEDESVEPLPPALSILLPPIIDRTSLFPFIVADCKRSGLSLPPFLCVWTPGTPTPFFLPIGRWPRVSVNPLFCSFGAASLLPLPFPSLRSHPPLLFSPLPFSFVRENVPYASA